MIEAREQPVPVRESQKHRAGFLNVFLSTVFWRRWIRNHQEAARLSTCLFEMSDVRPSKSSGRSRAISNAFGRNAPLPRSSWGFPSSSSRVKMLDPRLGAQDHQDVLQRRTPAVVGELSGRRAARRVCPSVVERQELVERPESSCRLSHLWSSTVWRGDHGRRS
jgi:hypothetical protein